MWLMKVGILSGSSTTKQASRKKLKQVANKLIEQFHEKELYFQSYQRELDEFTKLKDSAISLGLNVEIDSPEGGICVTYQPPIITY